MLGMAPNPAPDGSNWTVLFGAFEEDEDADDDVEDEQIGVVALSEDSDIPEVTKVEHRFSLWELEQGENEAVVVYVGAALHRHGDDPADLGCETFLADEGEATVEDIPDDLRKCLNTVLDMEIYPPGEEPLDAEPVFVEDMVDGTPNTNPEGMFY